MLLIKVFWKNKKSQLKAEILNGAPEESYMKLLDNITWRYKARDDIITAYLTLLKNESKFS